MTELSNMGIESRRVGICIGITDSFCSAAETNMTV